MPTYIIKAPNGKQLEVTGDAPPSEAELDAIFKAAGVAPTEPEVPTRGGVTHPLTSIVQPELEAVRGKLNVATAERPGDTQPVMARSRTGALYPSGVNTGGVGAIARGVASGAGNAAISQVEGATSPAGIVAAAVPVAIKAGQKVAETVAAAPQLKRAVQIGKVIATDPDAIGIASPRAGNAIRMAQKLGPLYTKARDTVDAANAAPTAATAVPEAIPAAAGMSPQRTLNELALAARRAGTKLTPEQEASALDLIKGGQSPTDAVSAIIPPTRSHAVGTLLKMAAKPPADVSDTAIKLTAQEFQRGADLLAQGKSAKEALAAILSARARGGSSAFAALPTDAEMTAEMGQRAASGQKSLMAKYGPKP